MTMQITSKFHARVTGSRGAVEITITCKSSDRDFIPEGAAQFIAEAFLEAGVCWDAKPIPFTVSVVQVESVVLDDGFYLHPDAFRNDGFVYSVVQRSGRCIQYKVGGHRSLKVGKIFQLLGRKYSTLKPDYNKPQPPVKEEARQLPATIAPISEPDSPVKRIFCESARASSGSHIRRSILERFARLYLPGEDPVSILAKLLGLDWIRPVDEAGDLFRVTLLGREQFEPGDDALKEPSVKAKLGQLDKLLALISRKGELAQMARELRSEMREYHAKGIFGHEEQTRQTLAEVNSLLQTIEEVRTELAIIAWPLSRQIK